MLSILARMEDLQEPIISKGGISLILIMQMEGGKLRVVFFKIHFFECFKNSDFEPNKAPEDWVEDDHPLEKVWCILRVTSLTSVNLGGGFNYIFFHPYLGK